MRDDASQGICKNNGIKELDDMLEDTMGYILLQEQIMQFLVTFCNYTEAESDVVRRAIGKKTGTEALLPEIERRFMEYAPNKFNINNETATHIIKETIQTILDCSNYSFSKNHNFPYSFTGYIAGYLRYYYPLEFATACLNTWTRKKKSDKIYETTLYIQKRGIRFRQPKFRYSKAEYFMDKENNTIYKGIASIKYMNENVANEMYKLKDNKYNNFMELLIDLQTKTSINSRQLSILITIDFFEEFGKSQKLLDIVDLYNNIMAKKIKSTRGEVSFNKNNLPYSKELIEKYATDKSKEDRYKQYKVENAEGLCNEIIEGIADLEMSSIEKIRINLEMMGECNYHYEDYSPSICVVVDVNTKYKTKKAKLFNIASGRIAEVKIGEGDFGFAPFKELDVIEILTMIQKPKKVEVLVGDKKKWRNSDTEKEFWLTEHIVLDDSEIEELNREEKEYRISVKTS